MREHSLLKRKIRIFQEGGRSIILQKIHRQRDSEESHIVTGKMKTGIKLGKYSIKIYLKKLQQPFLSSSLKKRGEESGNRLFILFLK